MPHLPSPTVSDATRGPDFAKRDREGSGGDDLVTALARLFPREKAEKLFKTPTANLASNGSAQHPDKRKAGGHGPTLEDEVVFLLDVDPDDVADDGPHSPAEWWGPFATCVYRWEIFMGRQAPIPLMRGPRGGLKLAPKFCEWMMGLPGGWVTDVPDLTREEQIGRIGNGVCPQQAHHAFRFLREQMNKPLTEHTEESNGQGPTD
ncbi:DNA (cytosine-5-)-methyltransferase [Streptomyces sp. CA-135486]|uniref:DNA (cytosine-5-)-methyltransferase n=1 Tax=Streptomyces sp. CA-135486 TaxID=3240049 RepID=UPI003D8F3160